MSVIAVDGSSSSTATKRAVDGISFQVEAGEVYALLGQNGAGKSTTVEILEGHRSRTAGRVQVLGADPADGRPRPARPHRHRPAVIGDGAQAHGARDRSACTAACYRRAAAGRRVHRAGRARRVRRPADRDPVGRTEAPARPRRRASSATPELLFLDEPTTGLRPGRPAGGVGPRALAVLRRHHGAAHVALPRRGRAPRRPRRRARRRPARRARARRSRSPPGRVTTIVRFGLPDEVAVRRARRRRRARPGG